MRRLKTLAALCLMSGAFPAFSAEPPPKPMVLDSMPVIVPPGVVAETNQATESLQSKGYVDRTGKVPDPDFVLRRIDDHFANPARSPADATVYRITDFNSGRLRFPIGLVPKEYAPRDVDAFITVSDRRVMRVYRNSKPGATLITEETGRLVNPSGVAHLTIDGHPAFISRLKYGENRWVTALLSWDGSRAIFVQVSRDTRVPADYDELIRLMTSLLSSRAEM